MFRYLFTLGFLSISIVATALEQSPDPNLPNPSARGCSLENGPTFTASFLYWKINQDNMLLAYKVTPIDSSTSNFAAVQFDFEANPGFRLGLGYNTCYDGWDVKLHWTEIESSPTASAQSSLGIQISPNFGLVGIAQSVSASWDFTLNTLDAQLGRLFWTGKAFSVRPYSGVLFSWISQHERVLYLNGLLGSSSFSTLNIKGDSRFFGAGPEIGVDLSAKLGVGLSLVASTFTSLQFGWFNVMNRYDALGIIASKFPFYQSSIKPLVDITVGLDWSRCFKSWFYFNIGAFYEAQFWWDQNQFNRFGNTTTLGDLSLKGLTIKTCFEF